MEINHDAGCLCEAFGLTCEEVQKIRSEVKEIVDRADKITETIELSLAAAGNKEREKVIYMFLLGKELERRRQGRSDEESGQVQVINGKAAINILNQIMRKMHNREEDDSD